MDVRVLKIRLENCLTSGAEGELFRQQVKDILDDINKEVETSDKIIDAGMIGSVVDELRLHYFKLLDEYSALPKTFGNLVKRANYLDDLTITMSKITNYISFAITRNASSADPATQRICAIIKPELENYRKELFNIGSLMQNVITDKKIYIEKMRENNDI